jgi:hypothetical protein
MSPAWHPTSSVVLEHDVTTPEVKTIVPRILIREQSQSEFRLNEALRNVPAFTAASDRRRDVA